MVIVRAVAEDVVQGGAWLAIKDKHELADEARVAEALLFPVPRRDR
jgi:hypothetical protein